ncbi:MAG: GTP-binding protein [Candidatus Helarchaeota archaeon]|nr:GTP-binding protein [Candidatus Helarchaeota archaeon]
MINHIWIIKNSGENLFHKNFGKSTMQMGEDLISGFFIALDTFAKESGKGEIDSITLKDAKFIYMNFGAILIVAGCERSDEISQMKEYMSSVGNKFIEKYGNLEKWDGDIDGFQNFSDTMDTEFNPEDWSKFQIPMLSKDEIKEESKHKKKFLYKTVIVGNSGVGKTCLLNRFVEDRFESKYKPTLGVDIKRYTYEYNSNTNFSFTAWDVSGQASFKSLRKVYYPNTQSFLILFDLSDRNSFQKVDNWLDEIHQYGNKNGVFLLVGNKKDLQKERNITPEEGKQKADELGFDYFETSAKTGDNVTDLFRYVGQKLIERRMFQN